MILLIASIALGLSYLLNKLMLKLLRERAVTIGAPVFEELLKTLPAYFLNRSILYVHLLFGLGEALYDFITGRGESGRWAAVFSIVSHGLFGVVTHLVLQATGNIYWALLSTILIHGVWNLTIMRVGKR